MRSVWKLLFFFRLNKVVLQLNHSPKILLISMATLPVNSRKKLEKASVGTPCSEFYFMPFLLELLKSSLATPHRMIFRDTLALKGCNNRDGKQSPGDTPQPHLRILLPSIIWSAVRGQHRLSNTDKICTPYTTLPGKAWLPSRHVRLRSISDNNKLISISAIFR